MYSILPSFVLGFHGCDKEVGEKILAGKGRLLPSKNSYDWLGHGIYFWENNPSRAYEYAVELRKNPKRTKGEIEEPFVLGAIIYLGSCLNLLDSKYLKMLRVGYEFLKRTSEKANLKLPQNKSIDNSDHLILRPLDCAVIEMVHFLIKKANEPAFDTVRGVFIEGRPIYDGTDICENNHIQICVRNPNCIKGYFRPLEKIDYKYE